MFWIEKTLFHYKVKNFQSSKNRTFPKGLTDAFDQKMFFFSLFVFGQRRTRNKVYDVLDRKETFHD